MVKSIIRANLHIIPTSHEKNEENRTCQSPSIPPRKYPIIYGFVNLPKMKKVTSNQ